jgi:mono/diheme cytochrome c family protein
MPVNARSSRRCIAAGAVAGATLIALAVAPSLAADPKGVAADPRELAKRGEQVFKDQGCYGCHTVGKMGTPIAPDLAKIGARRDRAYLARWLSDPASQRPTAHMPKLQLSEPEVAALAAYLSSLR